MDLARLDELLNRFSSLNMLVVGDFFLDKYLIIDRQLGEISLETGLEAHQVVEVRCSPGAAGTVASNLRALGVGATALGVIGDDGNGHDLQQSLRVIGVDIASLIQCNNRFTPTYTKPMVRESDGREHEIERQDIKNRSPTPLQVEDALIQRLRALVPKVDGVVIADQVPEANCGVVTNRVRDEIAALAYHHPHIVFVADSRERIGLFRGVIVKPNAREAALAAGLPVEQGVDLAQAGESGHWLYQRNGKPVFVTVGAQGILACTQAGCEHAPAVTVGGPIDIVGAGDSVMAGVVSALCSGATSAEAALLGNLVASITIQQLGTTGTATPTQVRDTFQTLAHG